MYTTIKRLVPLFTVLLILPGCMPANNDYDVLKSQVNQHDQMLSQLNMQLSNMPGATADLWAQVQSLRQDVATLRGEMDTLNHSMSQSGGAAALADSLARHERALRLIETQLAMDLQLSQATGGMGGLGAADPSALGQPTYGQPATTPPATIGQPTPVTQPPASAGQPTQGGDVAQQLYDAGMTAFNNRRYEQGLKSFSDFTEVYPTHTLASNAWFWQGECHYQLKNYAAAALAYEKVIGDFPNSNKAPAAYLKQGLSFAQLGKKDAARERLNQLVQTYPRAPEATRAQQEIQKYQL